MDTDDASFPESPNYFTAVQITRPVFYETKPSITETPVNHIKVAKLVLSPKPVRVKAKVPIKNNQQQQKEITKVSDEKKSSQSAPILNLFTTDEQNKEDDGDQLMKKQDIELERKKKPKATVKTLNAAPVQSPHVHKSKMDEGIRCEARKFMKKQREKRKMEVKKEVDKSFVIKQRLEELRQHTKDAIARKAKMSPSKSAPPPLGSSYYSLSNHKMKEIKVLKLKPMKVTTVKSPQQEIPVENVPESPAKQPPKNQASVSPMKLSPNPQASPSRLETKRQSSQPSTRPSSSKENKKSDNNSDLRLIVPDVKLSMLNTSTKQILNRSDHSTAHNNQTFIQPLATNIPSWLQNSIIQPYPYNFIWAVRKKLEAYTKTQNENVKNKKNIQCDLETPQIKRNKKSAKARRLDQNLINQQDENDSETNAKSEDIEQASEANTISEISSIRSDIASEQKSQSLERQSIVKNDSESIFHTVSEGKFIGKKRESVNSEFDRASFDKKLQALGPENVSPNTTVKRNNFLSSTLKTDQPSNIEEAIFKKPDNPISTKTELNDLDNNNKENEDKEEEFKKMLLAFNKSLSHVVEVNHLLSAALVSKSSSPHASISIKSSSQKSFIDSQIQSSASSKRDSEHDNKYSSSFEKNIESSEKTSNISEMIENMIQADTKQQHQQQVNVNDKNSDGNSSIQTLIADSDKINEAIEDPPIVYQSEQPQELTSSTTKITLTKTDNNFLEYVSESKKNGFETTLNESKLISMFRLSESEVSFIESVADQHDGNNLFMKSTTEIKSWERSLIERTRGQISWLELQKLNFKKHGQHEKVSAIKKQQRAILLRLEKERIKLREENSDKSDKLIDQAVAKLETSMDLTGNDSDVKECIERILQQREQKIIQRRKKIEHLVNWQRRLDDEEKKLKYLERELLNANKSKSRKKSSHDLLDTSFEMVKSIDHSLKILDNDVIARDDEKVEIIGSKMNKLWYRLTGLAVEKFIPKRIYQLTKTEIAKFYEDAKEAVLESDLKILLETSAISPEKPDMKSLQLVEEEKKTSFSRSDTMNSIANIETEEEYPNSYTNEETATQSENDNELQELMANQMKVFVDHKIMEDEQHVQDDYKPLIASSLIATVNDKTFQVQNTQKDESQSQGSNMIIASESNVEEIEEVEEESENINTEQVESEVFDELSMIFDTNSTSHVIQITDMDQDEDENIQMIENISFPNLEISLSDTLQNDFEADRAHDLSTITECTEYEQGSSGPISSEIITHSTTPTTSERLNSEIEQRLLSINDSLEQVEEAFKKVPLKSSTTAVSSSITYSTDKDFVESPKATSLDEEEIPKSDLVLSTPTTESGSQIATSTPKILMPDVISGAESLK